mmetsp:Transcript_14081/g.28752  ORF Transcript_14081/g.28752 Transcript_14081/m.28752 type:complete len:106 (+) Transcript_14081:94-411(+)
MSAAAEVTADPSEVDIKAEIKVEEVEKRSHTTSNEESERLTSKSKKRKRREDDGKERDKRGSIIRMCGISGCTYKTENSTNLKNHKASKHGIEAVDGKDRSASTT